mmetsp:Transcript_2329/g.7424  ORF Transcript_2329/g.7424 Transcript_2329/m.7424 type:complete len:285 (+) Transcript_2329:478-1332(+)
MVMKLFVVPASQSRTHCADHRQHRLCASTSDGCRPPASVSVHCAITTTVTARRPTSWPPFQRQCSVTTICAVTSFSAARLVAQSTAADGVSRCRPAAVDWPCSLMLRCSFDRSTATTPPTPPPTPTQRPRTHSISNNRGRSRSNSDETSCCSLRPAGVCPRDCALARTCVAAPGAPTDASSLWAHQHIPSSTCSTPSPHSCCVASLCSTARAAAARWLTSPSVRCSVTPACSSSCSPITTWCIASGSRTVTLSPMPMAREPLHVAPHPSVAVVAVVVAVALAAR